MIAYLTAGLLLLHSIAGCCWHHGHQAAGNYEEPAAACAGHQRCAHHQSHDAGFPAPHEGDGHQEQCQGERCAFVLMSGLAAVSMHSLQAAVTPALDDFSPGAWSSTCSVWSPALGPADRLMADGPLVLRI